MPAFSTYRFFKPSFTALAFVLVLAFVLGLPLDDARASLQSDIQKTKAEERKLVNKTKDLDKEIKSLQKNLVKSSDALRNTQNDLHSAAETLNSLNKEKDVTIEKIYINNESLSGVIGAVRRRGRGSILQLLLQNTPENTAKTSLLLRDTLPRLQKESADLHQQLHKLEQLERDIERQQAVKTKKLSDLRAKEKEMNALLDKRRAAYKQTEQARKKQEAALKALAAQARNLEDLVSKIQKKPARPETAAAPAQKPRTTQPPADLSKTPSHQPVYGTVKTAFGEKDALGAQSKGVTYATTPAAVVVSPLKGRVKFAGPFQKYKQILIIEHDAGYHSLIAGMGHIDTVVGASLAAGEPVGTADDHDGSAAIYYELRRNGKPVNPRTLSARGKT